MTHWLGIFTRVSCTVVLLIKKTFKIALEGFVQIGTRSETRANFKGHKQSDAGEQVIFFHGVAWKLI